jgi:hypothetical protein
MEIPQDVLIHNEILGMKGAPGRLLRVTETSYELLCDFGDKSHRVLLPLAGTVLIQSEAEEPETELPEIER